MLAEKPSALSDARRLSQRVQFEPDGTVSIASGKVELGQGILTALAQIAAEELDVDLRRIRLLPASTPRKLPSRTTVAFVSPREISFEKP